MAFSTLNGDVDLDAAGGVKFDVRLRSDNGEIYSDFDVALSPQGGAGSSEDRGKGKYRVSVAKELTGKIGGGGPEIFLKTFNGDIVLRKGKARLSAVRAIAGPPEPRGGRAPATATPPATANAGALARCSATRAPASGPSAKPSEPATLKAAKAEAFASGARPGGGEREGRAER